jgi:Tfp pilus assembly protein PilV
MKTRPHNLYRRRQAGFTLMEAAMTTMIVGVGLVATLQLLAAGTASNIDGARTTTGVNLARGIRELTLKMTFDEVRALDGRTYNPPIDSRGTAVNGFDQWSQAVTVQAVDKDGLTTQIVDPTSHAVRVTVVVSQHGKEVSSLSWYRFLPTP